MEDVTGSLLRARGTLVLHTVLVFEPNSSGTTGLNYPTIRRKSIDNFHTKYQIRAVLRRRN